MNEEFERKSMLAEIEYFLRKLSELTKEEADWIESVINWPEEARMAFKFAKRIFEEK